MTIKLIHCADLHLATKEKDYSLAVFSEIIEIANRESADYLLMAGDIFDSFPEIEKLKTDFQMLIRRLSDSCEPFLLAGNHEDLNRKDGRIASFDLGIPSDNIIDKIDKIDAPYRLIERPGLEILAIPHQQDYSGYIDWKVPEKRAKFRVALAHAANENLAFIGLLDEENKAGVIDSDVFQRFGVDYAALGHIHRADKKIVGGVQMAYSGSARVWRKDETGPRVVNMVKLSDTVELKPIPIKSAGQFKRFVVNLNLNGEPETDLSTLKSESDQSTLEQVEPQDWVWLELLGLVEDELKVETLKESFRRDIENRVRRLNIEDDDVESCAGISGLDIVKKFLEIWEARQPAELGDERDVWRRAREIGLKAIKEHLEARS